jgi:hypothetical protein
MTEMNYEISESTATQLGILKGKFLMRDNVLFRISDYKIEDVTETPEKTWLNRNPKPRTKKVLKAINVLGYNDEGHFLGTFSADFCRRLITWFDLYYLRNNWIRFNEQLEAFGFEIRPIEKKKDNEPSTFAELAKETLNK